MRARKTHVTGRDSARCQKILIALALVLGIALAGSAEVRASQYCYGCVLNGTQESPPTPSGAFGGGQFLIDTVANTVSFHIVFTGLSAAETAAHIHGMAGPGANAGVLFALPAGGTKVGVWAYAEAQEADILDGRTYVNIHTGAFPGGEVRGQVVPLNAQLNGAQESPPNASPGVGWGVFSIDTVANNLSYYIVFNGLSGAESGAHIHGPALHGGGAGVLQALPLGSPKIGVWAYAEALESDILTGRTYVNIHTGMFPGGEIRGQIVPIVAPMDGGQEVPPNASTGAGLGLISYDDPGNTLSFDIRYAGLMAAETAAHIHGFAPPGANAGVLTALPAGNPKVGTWVYGAADEAAVFDGRTYMNIHTGAFPGGEIRGQIQCFLNAPTSSVNPSEAQLAFRLEPGEPNPFTRSTRIDYRLDEAMAARLALYDAQGREVRVLASGFQGAGAYSQTWDGRDDAGRAAASGVYWYVLETPMGRLTRSLNLVR